MARSRLSRVNIEEYLPEIRVPVLVIQGADDQYGTLLQVKAIQDGCHAPVRTVLIEDCGHSPHVDQPELTIDAIWRFLHEEVADLNTSQAGGQVCKMNYELTRASY